MKINIHSLKPGINEFEFEKSGDELTLNNTDLQVDSIRVKSKVDKRNRSVVVNSRFDAAVRQSCDRCLTLTSGSLQDDVIIYYTSDKEAASFDDEQVIRVMGQNNTELDLAAGLRESILLAIPMKAICSEECKGLCPSCGGNLNERACGCKIEKIDTRWDGLKKLLDRDPVSD